MATKNSFEIFKSIFKIGDIIQVEITPEYCKIPKYTGNYSAISLDYIDYLKNPINVIAIIKSIETTYLDNIPLEYMYIDIISINVQTKINLTVLSSTMHSAFYTPLENITILKRKE